MGMLPIFVAFGGFVFLWVILSYQTMKQRRETVAQQDAEIERLLRQRADTLATLHDRLPEWPEGVPSHPAVPADPTARRRPDGLAHQFEAWAAAHPEYFGSAETGTLRRTLITNEEQLIEHRRDARAAHQHYHELLGHMPTGWLARQFGFKELA